MQELPAGQKRSNPTQLAWSEMLDWLDNEHMHHYHILERTQNPVEQVVDAGQSAAPTQRLPTGHAMPVAQGTVLVVSPPQSKPPF